MPYVTQLGYNNIKWAPFVIPTYNLYMMGGNTYGQLGLNDTTYRSSPVQVAGTSWRQFSAGSEHNLAIKSDGTLWAWGNNDYYQVASDNVKNSYKAVATGSNFSYLLSKVNNKLLMWGDSSNGQPGNNTGPPNFGTPYNFLGSPVTITSCLMVAAGSLHVATITSTGSLYTWGNNTYGQLGDGTTTTVSYPIQVVASGASKVHARYLNTGYIDTSGIMRVAGMNQYGQLGVAAGAQSTTFRLFKSPLAFAEIAVGSITAGITTAGELWASGRYGAGANFSVSLTSPVSLGTGWSKVQSFFDGILALKSNGTLWSWGGNTHGTLGVGDTITRSSPVQIGTDTDWTEIFGGAGWALGAKKSNGDIYVWGSNFGGMLGLNDTINRSVPTYLTTDPNKIISFNFSGAVQVSTSTGIAEVVGASAKPYENADAASQSLSSPVQIPAIGLGIFQIKHRSSPTQIGTANNWVKVFAGDSQSVAINSNKNVYVWGGTSGLGSQLGIGNQVAVSTPTLLPNPDTNDQWDDVQVTDKFGAGIYGNTLYTWGYNATGALGLGDRVSRSSPTQVAGTWKKIGGLSSFGESLFMIAENDKLFATGDNQVGQLGQNDRVYRSTLTQIPATSWTQVDGRGPGGIDSNGNIWAWGISNTFRNLTITNISAPVQMTSNGLYKSINWGIYPGISIALRTDNTIYGSGPGGYLNGNSTASYSLTQLSFTTLGTADLAGGTKLGWWALKRAN